MAIGRATIHYYSFLNVPLTEWQLSKKRCIAKYFYFETV